jgi:hypothetical protein
MIAIKNKMDYAVMGKFWRSGIASLRKEITIIIAIKLIAIFALWWAFFSNPIHHRPLLQELTQPQLEKRVTHDNNT